LLFAAAASCFLLFLFYLNFNSEDPKGGLEQRNSY
jgi:hypothetical protein